MIAVDYGANNKLKAHGPSGPVELPIVTRGLSDASRFAEQLRLLLDLDDVVTESPTPGSSGAEAETIRDIVAKAPHVLYTISARQVKNRIKDLGLKQAEVTDERCAELIYEIATRVNAELKVWRYVPASDKFHRMYTSVRPYDKRGYEGSEVDRYMALLPPFTSLPDGLQELFTNGKKKAPDYARARAFPLARALAEDGATSRGGYEKVIGLYADGYPSYYRRATVTLMQRIAKSSAGVTRIAEVTPEQRKAAWRLTRKHIRHLYHLAQR